MRMPAAAMTAPERRVLLHASIAAALAGVVTALVLLWLVGIILR